MSEKKSIKLEKEVKSNIYASKLNDGSFNALAKPQEIINNQKIRDTYNGAKYQIPRFGKKSHETVVNQSTEYLYPDLEKNLEDAIEVLIAKIGGLNQKLAQTNLPDPTHNLYANGTMLTAGDAETGQQYTGMLTVWVMDRGVKRAFASEVEYLEVRKAFKHPGDPFSELVYLTLPELNAIPDGKTITTGEDLSIPLSEINADYGGIYFEREHNILLLHCQGQEVNDTYDLLAGNYYVDNTQQCMVRYIEDDYYEDGIGDQVRTLNIPAGQTATVKALKHAGLPSRWKNNESLYDNFYDYNQVQVTSSQTPGVFNDEWDTEIGSDVTEFASNNTYTLSVQPGRKWGKDREYKGIVYASGRIDILKINGIHIGASGNSPYQEWFLNTKDTTPNIPSALVFNDTVEQNRKIYNICRQLDGTIYEMCYGKLNQDINDSKLNEIWSNNSTNHYYVDTIQMSKNLQDPTGYYDYSSGEPVFMGIGTGGPMEYDPTITGNFHNIYNLKGTEKIVNNYYSFYGQPLLKGGSNRESNPKGDHLVVLDIDPNSQEIWFYNLNQKYPYSLPYEIAQQKFMMVKEGVITPNTITDWEPIIIGHNHFNWEKVNSARLSYIGLINSQPNRALGQGNYWNFKSSPHSKNFGQAAGSNYMLTVDSQQKLDANLQIQHTVGCESHNEDSLYQFYQDNNNPFYDPSILPEGCHFGNCIDC